MKEYSFVILDLALRLFTLAFSLITNETLSREAFSELSYFRATLSMVVGLSANALGLYLLNYYKSYMEDMSKRNVIISVVVTVLTCSQFIFVFISLSFPEVIGLNIVTGISPVVLVLTIIFASIFQLSIFFIKVISVDVRLIKILLYNSVIHIVVLILWHAIYVGSTFYAYSVLLSYYAISLLLVIKFTFNQYFIIETFKNYRFDINHSFRSFYIPNWLESAVSVPIIWLSFTILIKYEDISNVGDIVLIQMILGLIVFFVNSIILNKFSSIVPANNNSVNKFINETQFLIRVILASMLSICFLFWQELRSLLNIESLSDISIFILCLSTSIQVYLMPYGAYLKRAGFSSLTLLHNICYGFFLILFEYSFLHVGIDDAYAWSFFFTWIGLFLIIISHVKGKIPNLKRYIGEIVIFILFFFFIFYLNFVD